MRAKLLLFMVVTVAIIFGAKIITGLIAAAFDADPLTIQGYVYAAAIGILVDRLVERGWLQ